MKSYEEECQEFIADMLKEGVPENVSKIVLRNAQKLTNMVIVECNRYLSEGEIDLMDERKRRIAEQLDKILTYYGCVAIFQNDPRGAVVKLKVPSGRTDDWGQTGICVPARA